MIFNPPYNKKVLLQKIAHQMSVLLVDEYVLATITKHAQNNMDQVIFNRPHQFFQDQYVQIDKLILKIAVFIRSIGHYAPETPYAFKALERLKHIDREPNDCKGCITELLTEHETIIEKLEVNKHIFSYTLPQPACTTLNDSLMRSHSKMARFLRNYY